MHQSQTTEQTSTTLAIEREYLFISIDIVRDFVCSDGIFAQTYGLDDVRPIIEVTDRIVECIKYSKDPEVQSRIKSTLICCQSEYKHKQFKTQGLENLCVLPEGQESVIPYDLFDYKLVKTTNSMFDVKSFQSLLGDSQDTEIVVEPKQAFLELLSQFNNDKKYIVIMGVTSNSCVRTSSTELSKLGFKNILIPLDCVACRSKTQSGIQFLEKETKTFDIMTVKSWKDLYQSEVINQC